MPHRIEPAMRYRRPRDMDLAARVQLFVRGPATPTRFGGRAPAELLTGNEWAWHDLGAAATVPEGALTESSFNGRSARWAARQSFELEAEGLGKVTLPIAAPVRWISAATFRLSDGAVQPDTLVLHIANEAKQALQITSLRLWLAEGRCGHARAVAAGLADGVGDRAAGRQGVYQSPRPKLKFTYAALELSTSAGSLWAHLQIKRPLRAVAELFHFLSTMRGFATFVVTNE